MIFDNNLICYEYYKNQYTPNPVESSGAKDGDVIDNKYNYNKNNYAVLILEQDIINNEGYGLKRGFYNVVPDEYQDFLLVIQSGEIKAKVPVAKIKFFETLNPEQFKVKKMSYGKYKKQQQKEYKKYMHGENPNNIEIKTAEIHQLDEQNSFILIYNTGNLEISGIIKF